MDVTTNIALEIAGDEAAVLEAYKDSVGIWTWGIGVTDASGHRVFPRYKDKPQTMERVLEVFVWLLEAKYAPGVRKAFKGCELTEQQFGAALSFHYNTGAIGRASWVKKFVAGDAAGAKKAIMAWNKAGGKVSKGLTDRRKREQNLFFNGVWHSGGSIPVYSIKKPSYTPDWGSRQMVECRGDLDALLGKTGEELLPPKPKSPKKPRKSLFGTIFRRRRT